MCFLKMAEAPDLEDRLETVVSLFALEVLLIVYAGSKILICIQQNSLLCAWFCEFRWT